MKLSILFLAILGVSAAAALPAGKVLNRSARSLDDDLQDFIVLIPVDEILSVAITYLAEDAEVQTALAFILSGDFSDLVDTVNNMPEYIALLDLLEAGGLGAYAAINNFLSFLGLPELTQASRTISRLVSTRITGGVSGLIADIKALLPLAEIRALYNEKLESSEQFAALVALIASDDFQAAVAEVKANEQYLAIREKCLAAGIDVEAMSDLLLSLLGLGSSVSKRSIRVTRDLSADLDAFYALVPVDEILTIVIQYLAEDAEVQTALAFILSGDFSDLVDTVNNMPEYIALLDLLEAGGLGAYAAINNFLSFLGLPELTQASRTISRLVSTRITGGVSGLIADIKALLPLAEIRALYNEKLESSEQFAALVALIASDDFQAAVAEVKANEQYLAIREKCLAAGIDVEAMSDLLLSLLGLGSSVSKRSIRVTRDLSADLDAFYALVPVDEILTIVIQYLAEDAEVQTALAFILSGDFSDLVDTVNNMPEYIALLDLLEAGGLGAYAAINNFLSFLGLPELTQASRTISRLVSTRITGGVSGLIADIKALLPLAEIRALYNEKLESSEQFAALVALIASDDFQAAVAEVKANEQYLAIREKCLAVGIDVEAISKLLSTLLGLP